MGTIVSFEPDEASIEKTKTIVTHLEERLLSSKLRRWKRHNERTLHVHC